MVLNRPPVAPLDYTNVGFEALRESMLARARATLPEWTDHSPNDLGVMLVDLFAYAADVTLYYQDRIAQNLFPATSDEPAALIQLLRLIGYELRPPAPATADLRLVFDAGSLVPPVTVPAGTQFFATIPSGDTLTYETEREVTFQNAQLTPPDVLNLRYAFVSVVQGETIPNEAVGVADGSPSQRFTLRRAPVIEGSIVVNVTEPGNIVTRWTVVPTLADSGPADRHVTVQRDATGAAILLFGDGVNGMAPPRGSVATPVTVAATYRVGGGPIGNVPAGTAFTSALSGLVAATNPNAAAGGQLGEGVERARDFAPRLFRTQERAVTAEDYTDLALHVPGVGKARAVAVSWRQIALYVAPTGQVAPPSELLIRDILQFFEGRRMASTALKVLGPTEVDVYIRARVTAQPYVLQADAVGAVERAVADYLAFDAIDFGQQVFLSRIYDVIQSLPEVLSVLVTQFSTRATPPPGEEIAEDGLIQLGANELPRLGFRDNPLTPPDPLNSTHRPPLAIEIRGGVTS